jgi:L-alanine-DL-glutamate epimerase-like enolase superfamily enzyme
MSVVTSFETWICRRPAAPGTSSFKAQERVGRKAFGREVVIVRLTTDDGVEGIASCLAAFSTAQPLSFLHESIAPVVLGRDPHDREAIWQDMRRLDRALTFFPLYLPGPVDVALWDIAAKQAGLPLYKYLGAYRDRLPYYASSQFMPQVDDYLAEAERYVALGATAYKAHPSGDWRRNIEISEALRARFPDLTLMLDPAGHDYRLGEAVSVGRALERLGFHWLEEPFSDVNITKYAELCRTLDIPILATEASAGGPATVAEFIRAGAADIVRADVSWKWGVTGTLKVLRLAEAFGLDCELHTTTMGLMDVANLHVACAAANCEYHELYAPHEDWSFPMKEPLPIDDKGFIHVPQAPGLGVSIDWDLVDNTTLVRLVAGSGARA